MATTVAPETTTDVEYVVEEFLPIRGSWLAAWGGEGPNSFGYLSHLQDALDKKHALEADEAHLPEAERAQYRIAKVTTVTTKEYL